MLSLRDFRLADRVFIPWRWGPRNPAGAGSGAGADGVSPFVFVSERDSPFTCLSRFRLGVEPPRLIAGQPSENGKNPRKRAQLR